MFEQTFLKADEGARKPYTMLGSLLLQIAALAALIIVPLIYTQALPQARLRSVFAAPSPPPAPLPKPPAIAKLTGTKVFRLTLPSRMPPIAPSHASNQPPIEAPPDLPGIASPDAPYLPAIGESVALKPPDPPAAPVTKASPPKKLNIAHMEESRLIRKVQPEYPPMARQIRLQGTVEFTAVIGKSGAIENLQLLHGHPLLVKAAEQAILQWRYKPTLLNGEPVEVVTNIVVNFTLTGQ